jgi:hypothetical protein
VFGEIVSELMEPSRAYRSRMRRFRGMLRLNERKPAADGSIGNCGVMQDDQDGDYGTEAVDPKVAFRYETSDVLVSCS